ncbi:carboxypeptidase-like regulatory domain-containing protein [Fulvivirgaceae bacterium PWU4]|uniref:Carboxypeptidase-like regulatory domain-containing protein n=2 Tax=Chryseosolibacter histidini TaxID=2782349 RepID=A0AAP2DIJ7_9BACT|nr:carboxypeptidase-like regulatory domain-containing protein [Chryseosolibacter histidini]
MKNLSLSIPKPCSEKWENFSSTTNGALCGSCNKVVVDFTSMSDEALIDFFSKTKGHTCGRFRPDQLTTYTPSVRVKVNPGVTLLKAGLLSLLLVLTSKQASAQNKKPKSTTEAVEKRGRRAVPESTAIQTEKILKGVVLDEANKPMPGVNVVLKGSTTRIYTDVDGRFELSQKVKEGDVIYLYFIGYTSKEYVVSKEAGSDLVIRMACDIMTLGEVAVDAVYAPDQSGARRLWSKVKNLF